MPKPIRIHALRSWGLYSALISRQPCCSEPLVSLEIEANRIHGKTFIGSLWIKRLEVKMGLNIDENPPRSKSKSSGHDLLNAEGGGFYFFIPASTS